MVAGRLLLGLCSRRAVADAAPVRFVRAPLPGAPAGSAASPLVLAGGVLSDADLADALAEPLGDGLADDLASGLALGAALPGAAEPAPGAAEPASRTEPTMRT